MIYLTDYDVIIIGSGIGGSATGALLANAGMKTLILEKNNRIGGACSSYFKEGFTIDVACHFFSQCMKGRIGKILKRIGLAKKNEKGILESDYLSFRAPLFPSIKFKGQTKYSQMGFIAQLGNAGGSQTKKSSESEDTGFDKEEQKEFMKVIGSMAQMSKRDIKNLAEKDLDVKTWADQITKNKKVHDFLAVMVGTFFTIPPKMASASEYIICLQETAFKNDAGYPIGGAIAMPNAFIEGLKKYGGELRINAPVEKIIIENNMVKGIQVNGDTITSKMVISNAGIKQTVLKLTGEKYFSSDYVKKIKDLIPSYSSLAFKFALKKPIEEIEDRPVIQLTQKRISELKGFIPEPGEKKPKTPGYLVPVLSNMDPKLAPKGKQLIIIGTSAPGEVKSNWKKWLDAYLLDILEFYPQLDKDNYVEFIDTTTPDDIAKYLGKEKGPVEGTALTPMQSGRHRISSILPIEGLYCVGDTAGVDTHGVGTQLAVDSAIKLVDNLLSKKNH
ncbi:MAG: NAD(P)/FAD-dependent oxidoreductase [Candidatus Lokiarchaeota archaeon]|nr:NAD(P)/FAD-dependent oxidoreductase [Candidatus Lokiarchaeota archaeon]